MRNFLLVLLLSTAACPRPPIKPPLPPAGNISIDVILKDDAGQPIAGIHEHVNIAPDKFLDGVSNKDGYALYSVPSTLVDSFVTTDESSYFYGSSFNLHPQACHDGCHNTFQLSRKLPPAPSRDQILSATFVFQGSYIHQDCIQPTDLPWFDVATFTKQLEPCREQIFEQKRQLGDKVVQLGFFKNERSLYDESGQPYQQLTTFDYEHNPDKFVADVTQAVQNGFYVWVYLDGDGNQDQWKDAHHQFPIAYNALKNAPIGDLNKYVVYRPGWDGVFYGWPNDHETIPGFGKLVRDLCADCYLALEFNTGHIPLGEGNSDWIMPNGQMLYYDVLDVEFNDANLQVDSTWQILGRLLGPLYKRPPEQPANDDPNPPFYLHDGNARGKIYVNCFEYAEYEWVRSMWNQQRVNSMRDYLKSLGCYNVF